MISERLDRHPDPDYSDRFEYAYPPGAEAPCCLKFLWVDRPGREPPSVWLETCDGQRVCVPAEIRAMVAKRLAGGRFK